MSTFSVTNTNNSGSGSLRQAILDANALSGKDIINFDGVFADNIADTITLGGSSLVITDDLTINGTGENLLTVSGNNASRVFDITDYATVEIAGLTIANGYNSYEGGGILNQGTLTISNSTITANSGDGIYNNGDVTVNNSTISDNNGSGIQNLYGSLTVNNSTISGNRDDGISNSSGHVTVSNSTISDNGTGIESYGRYNQLTISNSTIFGNLRGGIYEDSGNADVRNSIVAGNFGTDNNSLNLNDFDVTGYVTSNGHNLIGSLNGSNGFDISEQIRVPITDVLDTTLRDNGGSVKTHALVTGSIAINAGSNADVPIDTTDLDGDGNTTEQVPFDGRGTGFARISGGQVDIGAYEAAVNVINGTRDRNTIIGTTANDIITGYQRGDTLTGGSGADEFVYTSIQDAGDIITDFQVGTDKIVFKKEFLNSSGLGNRKFTDAVSTGYLRFETQGNDTIVLIDPDGSAGIGRAIKLITVRDVSVSALNNSANFAFFPTSSTSTFTVTNTNASGTGSLRQAIEDANASLGKDIIKFDGVFDDNLPDTITLGSELVIRDDLKIEGTGADLLTISGNKANRVFQINEGVTVEIQGLTVSDGSPQTFPSDYGGAGILNYGNLTVSNSNITHNYGFDGSGILNIGNMTLNNTSVNDNQLSGIFNSGNLTINNSTISHNGTDIIDDNVLFSDCKGIFNSGTLTINNSTISNNGSFLYEGAGIDNYGTLAVNNSTISGNLAGQGGGIFNLGVATLNNSIIKGNQTSYYGGGIYNDGTLTVSSSIISNNESYLEGGGIVSNGILTVTNSTISANTVAAFGGGIYINSGTATVANTTISDNSAGDGAGINIAEQGYAPVDTTALLTVVNSTISHNSARYEGGGIYNNANLIVSNSTIAFNIAQNDSTLEDSSITTGGGIYNTGSATVNNSIIAGNLDIPNSVTNDITNLDVFGDFTSNGYNLIGDLSGSTGFSSNEQLNVPITDVLDTTLRDNGGTVKTHALVTGSPAINTGNNADILADITDLDGDGNITEPIPFDGRGAGFARVVDGQIDIGAYEAVV